MIFAIYFRYKHLSNKRRKTGGTRSLAVVRSPLAEFNKNKKKKYNYRKSYKIAIHTVGSLKGPVFHCWEMIGKFISFTFLTGGKKTKKK
jgi:hypothetical protein